MWPWLRKGKKIRFWVFGIFSVVLYQESLCEYFMAISKVLFEIWPFIYKPHYRPWFCFQLIFYYFYYFYYTLRSTTFLLFDLGYYYLASTFINLFEFTADGYFFTCDLDLWPQGQITDCNMKISCLAHNIFVIGFSL
jgi:hypothetical protein